MSTLAEEYREYINTLAPDINDLPGNLKMLATEIENIAPGLGSRITVHLASRFPGNYLYMHNYKKLEVQYRNAWMLKRYGGVRGDGREITVRDLALAVGLGLSQAEKIMAKEVEDGRQMELFKD